MDARSRKCHEATLVRADGVARSASPIGRSLKKRSAKSLGLKSFAELTTPSESLRRLRAFLLMPQPPLLFKEGNVSALKQSVNSFTPSKAGAYTLSDSASCDRHVRRRYLVQCESQCLVGSRCIRFVLVVLASMSPNCESRSNERVTKYMSSRAWAEGNGITSGLT